jgi:NAD-dependent dihydropyrimidine dehydrogenase PreA subunit
LITRFKGTFMNTWIDGDEGFIMIDTETCIGCGGCVTICGGDVFELKDKKAVAVRPRQCLECGCCEVVCPVAAITLCVPKGGTGIIYECG